jgi:molybdopterin-guanine dinucleotide biosynthesis protein A
MQASRLANVAGALLVMEQDASSRAAKDGAGVLRALFEETLALGVETEPGFVSRVVSPPEGPRSPLADLAALLAATEAERVLVLWPGAAAPPEDLPLALTAWPERDGVWVEAEGEDAPTCAIFRREPVLEGARSALSEGRRDLSALDERLDVERTTPAALGLAGERAVGFGAGH